MNNKVLLDEYHYFSRNRLALRELDPEKLLYAAQQISGALRKRNLLGKNLTHMHNSGTHQAPQGLPGAFSKALESIKLLRRNDIETAVMFTLMKSNKDSALEMIDLAEAQRVNALTIERVTLCGHSAMTDTLSSQELREIYEAVTIRANTLNNGLVIKRLRPLWINTACLNTRDNAKIGGFWPVGLTSLAIRRGCEKIDRCGGCRAASYEINGDYVGDDSQCWIWIRLLR